MRSPALLALTLALVLPASAGVVYDFVTTIETPRTSEQVKGRVWVEGKAYRAELVREGTEAVVISRDGDQTAVFLDARKQTWSNRSRAGKEVRSAELFLWPLSDPYLKGSPRASYRREEPTVVAGRKAVPHVIEVSFDVESRVDGARAGGTYSVTAHIWAVEDLPPLPMRRPLRTGYPAVDQELEKAEENVHGMVVRYDLEVTRTLDGGPRQRESTRTVVDHLEELTPEASRFEVPTAFEYAGPVTARRQ
jgi:hypothetical protein